MKPRAALILIALALAAAPALRAQVLVWSTGNNQVGTQAVADWIRVMGNFPSVTARDGAGLTANDLLNYQEVFFFTNSNVGGDPAIGDLLADFADTGRRLVVATFAWANQGTNTLGGRFITTEISPVVLTGTSLYTNATLGTTTATPFLAGVTSLNGYYRDQVQPTAGATVLASWSDGRPLLVTKGNVVAITLFPEDGAGQVSGDYRQLFVNALTVGAIPEPSTWALLALGLGAVVWLRRRSDNCL